jgi:uncharacterized protein YbdZ (MbtH family)
VLNYPLSSKWRLQRYYPEKARNRPTCFFVEKDALDIPNGWSLFCTPRRMAACLTTKDLSHEQRWPQFTRAAIDGH